jgi:hypothetical protein
MKKGLLLIGVIVLSLTSISCYREVGPNEKYTIEEITANDNGEIITENTETVIEPITPAVINETSSDVEKRMSGVTWLNPGKVNIDGLYSGASGEYKIKIHNAKTIPITFSVYSREAATTTEGYTKLPPEFNRWISITPSSITIPAQSIGEVLVTVKVGLRDRVINKKYEFWIGVMEASQTGVIRSEICSRWMLTTR